MKRRNILSKEKTYFKFLKHFMLWSYPLQYAEAKFLGKSVIDRGTARVYVIFWGIKKNKEGFRAEIEAWSQGFRVETLDIDSERKRIKEQAWKNFAKSLKGRLDQYISIAPPKAIPKEYRKNMEWL